MELQGLHASWREGTQVSTHILNKWRVWLRTSMCHADTYIDVEASNMAQAKELAMSQIDDLDWEVSRPPDKVYVYVSDAESEE